MLQVQSLTNISDFHLLTTGLTLTREISKPFCCDLLSIAMGKAPASSCWITVMANVNTLAVASLADVSCIILAEGAAFDEETLQKAITEEIPVFSTALPVFDAALLVQKLLDETL